MKNNKIVISYFPSNIFGNDDITIDIEKTSFGALRMLVADLNELAIKNKIIVDNTWHPVNQAYADLLRQLSDAIKLELEK